MKIKEILEYQLLFDNGTMIEAYHDQDCCEHVYADFAALKDTPAMSFDFQELKIEGVPDKGFRLNEFFVPCYNEQNGYYSDELKLIIISPNSPTVEINLAGFVEDKIE